MPRVKEVNADETKAMLDLQEAFMLIDVREESEWAAGRIPSAIHISKGVIERDIEANMPDHAAKLVLYCGGG